MDAGCANNERHEFPDIKIYGRQKPHSGKNFDTFKGVNPDISDLRGKGETDVHILFAVLIALLGFLIPMASFAQSADTEGTVEHVDEHHQTVTLSDGKQYQASDAFDFDGLKAGVKVVVFYTDTDGKRMINDLQIIQ